MRRTRFKIPRPPRIQNAARTVEVLDGHVVMTVLRLMMVLHLRRLSDLRESLKRLRLIRATFPNWKLLSVC